MFRNKFKKYKDSNLPIFDYKLNGRTKFYRYEDVNHGNGKIHRDLIEYDNLTEALGDVIHEGFYYSFNSLLTTVDAEGNRETKVGHTHAHDFDSVVREVYYNPKEFSIDEEDRHLYSEQEYSFLMKIRGYLLALGMESISYDATFEDINNVGLTEKALEFKDYTIKQFDNPDTAKNIISGKRNYFIKRKSKYTNMDLGERFLLFDNDSNYLGIIEVIEKEVKKIDDLKEEDVDYKAEGFKTLSAYKKDLVTFFTDACYYEEEEITEIVINRVKVVKKNK